MNAVIERADDIEELARFLSELNQQKNSHIGFCGEKLNDIYNTLKEDFIDDQGKIQFFIARNTDGEILTAIGLDIDDDSAEVWGPFNQTTSMELQKNLWEQLSAEYVNIDEFQFFINQENIQQQSFMNEIKSLRTGEHCVLLIEKDDFVKVNDLESRPYQLNDFPAFEELHNELFPNTYYDAETIVKRLNEENKLLTLKNDSNDFLGYAYVEIDQDVEEAAIEYIGISSYYQNQGLGAKLLKEAITVIFSFPKIDEIELCVSRSNTQAIHLYEKAGFKPKDHLISYTKKQ